VIHRPHSASEHPLFQYSSNLILSMLGISKIYHYPLNVLQPHLLAFRELPIFSVNIIMEDMTSPHPLSSMMIVFLSPMEMREAFLTFLHSSPSMKAVAQKFRTLRRHLLQVDSTANCIVSTCQEQVYPETRNRPPESHLPLNLSRNHPPGTLFRRERITKG